MKTSEIKFTVMLDEQNVPSKIYWDADDAEFKGSKEAKAFLISLWDKDENATMGIDLWTKEMLVDDMNKHFHHTFEKLADTYLRSTQNKEGAEMIKKFATEFAKKQNTFGGD